MLNKLQIIGRVGQNPSINVTSTGKSVCSFSVACNESWYDNQGNKVERTEWINCTAWEKLAETISQHVSKGMLLYVEGTLRTETYEKDGQTHYSTKCLVQSFKFLEKKSDTQVQPQQTEEQSSDEFPY